MGDPSHRKDGVEEASEADPGAASHGDQGPLAAVQAELAEMKDRWLRAVAEQANIRNQTQRQRDEAVRFAASQLAGDLVDTLDNLRRAIESAPSDQPDQAGIKPLLEGVEATESKLLATLARHGLQRIDPLGTAFDPHRHHAIFQRSDPTASEGTVIEVLQPGYMLHGRVLRPAMVGVAVRDDQGTGQ